MERSLSTGTPTIRSRDAARYHALVRKVPPIDLVTIEQFRIDDEETTGRIRCPRCEWRPSRSSLWYCLECRIPEGFSGGCGTAWNTFDTRGVCPGCRYRWRWTSCHACGTWSRHDDWYTTDPR
jgi:hypothetical protein